MNILFTGARSGIASKTIEKLLNRKDRIFVTVKDEKQLQAVKKIYQNYDNVTCLKLDITKKNDYKQFDNIPIDVLICNAAIGNGGSLVNMQIDKIRENFEINVFSNFQFTQYILKQMIARKKGKIIFMSSLAGIIPIPFLGSYCATKASIIKLAQCLRKELPYIDADISLVLIEPGFYHTGFNQVMFENKKEDMLDNLFKEEIEIIRAKEKLLLKLLEQNHFYSITNKIIKAIDSNHPKFIYKAPFIQGIGAKLYQLFFE